MGSKVRKLLLFVILAILISPALAEDKNQHNDPKPDPTDIIGYRYDTNWWELGADIAEVELKGFRPVETNDPSIEVYYDAEHPIWFGRDTFDSHIILAFVDEKLALIAIRANDDGEDYSFYRKYYIRRQTQCTKIADSENLISWADKDNDTLSVENQPYWLGCPSVPSETVIVYLRRYLIQPDPVKNMPDWVEYIVNGMGFEGP